MYLKAERPLSRLGKIVLLKTVFLSITQDFILVSHTLHMMSLIMHITPRWVVLAASKVQSYCHGTM